MQKKEELKDDFHQQEGSKCHVSQLFMDISIHQQQHHGLSSPNEAESKFTPGISVGR